jgi:hypothetical protein
VNSGFEASAPPEDAQSDRVISNNTPLPYTFPLSKMTSTKTSGGSVKVVDSRTFKVSTTVGAVEVEVNVGGMRLVLFSCVNAFVAHVNF